MDHRRYKHNWFSDFDSQRMQFTVNLGENDNGEETVRTFPAKYEVCDTCEGRGKCVNPSIDERGLSAEDFDEDPDMHENYFSGMYDIACPHCKGERVMVEPAYDNMKPEDILILQDHIANYYSDQSEAYETWRMETGYCE